MTQRAQGWSSRLKRQFLLFLGRFYDVRSTRTGKVYIRLKPRKPDRSFRQSRRLARRKAFGIALLGLFRDVRVNSKSKKGKVQINLHSKPQSIPSKGT